MSAHVLDRTSPATTLAIVRANKHSLEHEMKMEREAEFLLTQHSHFRGQCRPIFFRCLNRSLVLSGKVDSYYLKQLAQEALRGLTGIDQIDNRIVVTSNAKKNPVEHSSRSAQYQQPNRGCRANVF